MSTKSSFADMFGTAAHQAPFLTTLAGIGH
jgi:hypothetical protein